MRMLEANSKSQSSGSQNTSSMTSSGFDTFTEISTVEKDQICVMTPSKSPDGVFLCSAADCNFKTASSKSIRMHLKSHLDGEPENEIGKTKNKIEIIKRKQTTVLGPDGGPIEPIKTDDGFCECPLCSKTFQLSSVFKLMHSRSTTIGSATLGVDLVG